MSEDHLDFTVRRLGTASIPSPLHLSKRYDDYQANYVTDDQRVIYDIEYDGTKAGGDEAARATGEKDGAGWLVQRTAMLEKAGPRELLFFEPQSVHAAVLTAGGLCPGLNDVLRAVVMTLWYRYGVRKITGLRYGYRGLYDIERVTPVELTPDVVRDIHRVGGTMLGSSRGGGENTKLMVDTLVARGINVLFTIGGDGTQKGALAIAREVQSRGLAISVIGIPKTIDNDLSFVERSFGFETAVAEACHAVAAAHIEARDAVDGIGLVKVMGRESGFIAASTALAQNDVNFVLIPEVPFELDGENGLLAHLEKRLDARHHAVILAAEGAGQSLLEKSQATDASGNKKLADVGAFLKSAIAAYFKQRGREVNLKYIDPSYIIRSAAAIPSDSIYCARLGSNAVHAAMSGRTECLLGLVNSRYVHVPMELAVGRRNAVDPEGPLWRDVVDATGQPPLMCSRSS
ncbi:MAG: ATP-dependent 6-phosphofructokinase [Polyangiaceae bacterium]